MPIDPAVLYDALTSHGIRFFAGVPDSLLAPFCSYVDEHARPGEHVVTPSEGSAIGLAAGYHLATGSVPAVYLQNSGLGNAVNPLASLTHPEVYAIPLVLIVGWRGEPGTKDEPQHLVQGGITLPQLDLLGIRHAPLDSESDVGALVASLVEATRSSSAPVALVVRPGTFRSAPPPPVLSGGLTREAAIARILDGARGDDLFVSTTGKASRELFELRRQRGEASADFLTVGSMGHAASIALGIAMARPERRVFCLDGDGAALMHLGVLPMAATLRPSNFVHVILNNRVHESVGGQSTAAPNSDFAELGAAAGYAGTLHTQDEDGFSEAWAFLERSAGPILWEVLVGPGSRNDLGRPTSTPLENKAAFMRHAGAG